MEKTSCPLCGSSHGAVCLTQRDLNLDREPDRVFTLMRCNQCRFVYLNPRPSPDEIRAYYPAEYYPPAELHPRKQVDRFFKRVSRGVKQGIREEFYGYPAPALPAGKQMLRRALLFPQYCYRKAVGRDMLPFRGEGRLLDVGCGPGRLLQELREQGWNVSGVDFSTLAVERAHSVGLNVKQGDLMSAAFKDNAFDVVLFNHSLEHMYDPIKTLQEAYRILRPGGALVLYLPNAGSVEARLFGKWWVSWDLPRHLLHFDRKTVERLVTTVGFEPERIQTSMSKSSFLGSVDYVYKHVLGTNRRHGWILRHLSGVLCIVLGHLGWGGELKVYAAKPAS